MENTTQKDTAKEEGMSLKEFLRNITLLFRFLLLKWWIILIAGLSGAGLGLLYGYNETPHYSGDLTFIVEDTKSGGLAAYAGLASQFGIDLGGGGGMGIFSGDNIMEFLKSRLMMESTLLTGTTVNGKNTSLADLYIDAYNLRGAWQKKPALANISIPVTEDRSKFTPQQDSILYEVCLRILKKNLKVTKPDKKLSFISVTTKSENELFSKFFTERLVAKATDFYIQTKTKRSKTNVDKLQRTADSILYLLNKKTYTVAEQQDINLNPVRKVASVGMEVSSRDKLMLQTIYGEVVKNLELAKMTMAQETPVIQVVDGPMLPLKVQKLGKLVSLILGGMLGGFLIVAFLVSRYWYKQTLA